MSNLKRFSVSIDEKLIKRFDKYIKEKKYPTRSKAIGDLITESLMKNEWVTGKEVTGAVTLVFDHHKRELVNKLTDIQHKFHNLVISSQHIHLDHDNCFEIIAVKGKSGDVQKLAELLKATKGVKFASLSMATTGKGI